MNQDGEEIKRHFDVVAEDLRSEIRMVAEGVAMNGERIDRVERRVEQVEGGLSGLRDDMRRGFAGVGDQIKRFGRRLARRETRPGS